MKMINILLIPMFLLTFAACELVSNNRAMESPQARTDTGSGNQTCPTAPDNSLKFDVANMNLKDLADTRQMFAKIDPQQIASLKIDDAMLASVTAIITNAALIDDPSIGLGFWNSTNSLQTFISICGLGTIPVDQNLIANGSWSNLYKVKTLMGLTMDQLKAELQTVRSSAVPMNTMSDFSDAASILNDIQSNYGQFTSNVITDTINGKFNPQNPPTYWEPAALCYICDAVDIFACNNDVINSLCGQILDDPATFFATQIAALKKDMDSQKQQMQLRMEAIKADSTISAQLEVNLKAAQQAVEQCKKEGCASLNPLTVAVLYAQQAKKAWGAGVGEYTKEGFDDTYNVILNQFNADQTQISTYENPCDDPSAGGGGAK